MIDQKTLESGQYWIRLKYKVTVDEWHDAWEVCYYNSEEDEWTQCGFDSAPKPPHVIDIDPERLEHKH